MRKRKKNGGRTPVRVPPREEAVILGDAPVRPTLFKDKGPQPAPTGGTGAPNPKAKGEQPGDKRTVPFTLGAGGTEKGDNAKKRKLNRQPNCLQAAGVERDRGAALTKGIWFLRSPLKKVIRITRRWWTWAPHVQSWPADC